MKIQRVNITANSPEELQMRIEELEKRGYTLDVVAPVERPEHAEISYDSSKRGATRKRTTYLGFEKHKAKMSRVAVEVMK